MSFGSKHKNGGSMNETAVKVEYADRRRRIRIVDRRNFTVQCRSCGHRWQPVMGDGGRVRRWGYLCPNPACQYHVK